MRVEVLRLEQFRNVESLMMEPGAGVNVIYGENAQGKTNILESIWLFTGFRSFRGAKDPEMIGFGKEYCRNTMQFYAEDRSQKAQLIFSGQQKRILLNEVPLRAASGLIGKFKCVVFSPAYINVIKGGPGEHRKFLDTMICQLKPSYAVVLNEFSRLLMQRNNCVKAIKYGADRSQRDLLEIWNAKLAQRQAQIVNARVSCVREILGAAREIHGGISGFGETLNFEYKMCVSPGGYAEVSETVDASDIERRLNESNERDIQYGATSVSVNHDDLEVTLNGKSAKKFGSQGQQRSAALAMKLSEAEYIYQKTGERPVALLDDVMSELDVGRQTYILNHIEQRQVFITCCEPSSVLRLCEGSIFKIRDGKPVKE